MNYIERKNLSRRFTGLINGTGQIGHRERSDEPVSKKTAVSFMVVLCFAFIERVWRGGTRV